MTDFSKPKVSKSYEEVNANLQNANVEQENDPHLNEKQNEDFVLKQGELFYLPKQYVFPKTKIENRNRSCQQHWFKVFPWLRYDERYIIFLI